MLEKIKKHKIVSALGFLFIFGWVLQFFGIEYKADVMLLTEISGVWKVENTENTTITINAIAETPFYQIKVGTAEVQKIKFRVVDADLDNGIVSVVNIKDIENKNIMTFVKAIQDDEGGFTITFHAKGKSFETSFVRALTLLDY